MLTIRTLALTGFLFGQVSAARAECRRIPDIEFSVNSISVRISSHVWDVGSEIRFHANGKVAYVNTMQPSARCHPNPDDADRYGRYNIERDVRSDIPRPHFLAAVAGEVSFWENGSVRTISGPKCHGQIIVDFDESENLGPVYYYLELSPEGNFVRGLRNIDCHP
jgi:hypothetical protein